ncbi:MAG: aliphatic sulfonate ABC transporter substrate-binding protein [Chroococcidiopsidaceae cyanobacterium CP_BM_ER_R8_30]|nr:aliphatic sulfonate ABC transporter substrate-binding protein [Chroococcidiopsidaceae cyanobacterium CP_BM_ER_R8_30]
MLRRFRTKLDRLLLLAITAFVLTWLLALAGCNSQSSQQAAGSQATPASSSISKLSVINVGYQSGTPGLLLLKSRGLLEKQLAPQGIKVKWFSFKGGPPMMEAMAGNSIDIGNVGNLPPIFAQAGGNPIVYVAATASNAGAQAVIVPNDSPIQTLADIKGKRLAIQQGTALQYLALKALASAKLTLNDIRPAYLTIPDSTAAFESGSVDVLPISDPYLASRELNGSVRVLVRGSDVAPQRAYYIATQNFAQNHPDLIKVILNAQRSAEDWAKAHPNDVAQLLADQTKYKPEAWELALKQRPYFGVFEMKDEYVAEQQQVVDLFYSQKLIPKSVQVKDAIWKPNS